MNQIAIKNNNWLLGLLAVFISISLFVLPLAGWGNSLISLFVFALFLAFVIVQKKAFTSFFLLTVWLLPISFEIPLLGETKLLFPSEVLVAILAIVVIYKMWHRLSRFSHPMYFLPALYLISYLPGILYSDYPVISIKYFMVQAAYITVFYLGTLLYLQEKKSIEKPLFAFFPGFLIVAGWAVFQFWQFEFNPITTRGIFKPFMNDHTLFGTVAAMLALLIFHFIPRKGNLFLITATAICVAALWFSGSRGAVVGFAGGSLLALVLHLRVKPVWIFGGLLAITFFTYQNRENIFVKLEGIKQVSQDPHADFSEKMISTGNISSDESNKERLNRWVAALEMARLRPHTGFGPGSFQFSYIPYQKNEWMTRMSVTNPHDFLPSSGGTVHSEYLLLLAEGGWPALLGFLLLLGRWNYLIFFKINTLTNKTRWRCIGAASALAAYLVHAFFNNYFAVDVAAFLFWSSAAFLEFSLKENKPST